MNPTDHVWRRISGPLAKQVLAEAEACGEPIERGDSGSIELADVRECKNCKAFRFNTSRRMKPVYLVPRFWVESKPWGSRVVSKPGPCGRHRPGVAAERRPRGFTPAGSA